MGTYLEDNPPRVRQFRQPRRATPSGLIVVHTAESFPDEVGPDSGAESVARFIRDRTNYGSYHDLCDSDSIVHLVPYDAEAYGDGTGSNPFAYHVSAATQAAKWDEMSPQWKIATVKNMARAAARYAKWFKARYGLMIPAERITREESDNRKPGFISHGARDPGRRSDPGAAFPWLLFFQYFSYEMSDQSDQSEEDDMAQLSDEDVDRIAKRLAFQLGFKDPDLGKNRSLEGTLTEIQSDLNQVMEKLGIKDPG